MPGYEAVRTSFPLSRDMNIFRDMVPYAGPEVRHKRSEVIVINRKILVKGIFGPPTHGHLAVNH